MKKRNSRILLSNETIKVINNFLNSDLVITKDNLIGEQIALPNHIKYIKLIIDTVEDNYITIKNYYTTDYTYKVFESKEQAYKFIYDKIQDYLYARKEQ